MHQKGKDRSKNRLCKRPAFKPLANKCLEKYSTSQPRTQGLISAHRHAPTLAGGVAVSGDKTLHLRQPDWTQRPTLISVLGEQRDRVKDYKQRMTKNLTETKTPVLANRFLARNKICILRAHLIWGYKKGERIRLSYRK